MLQDKVFILLGISFGPFDCLVCRLHAAQLFLGTKKPLWIYDLGPETNVDTTYNEADIIFTSVMLP